MTEDEVVIVKKLEDRIGEIVSECRRRSEALTTNSTEDDRKNRYSQASALFLQTELTGLIFLHSNLTSTV